MRLQNLNLVRFGKFTDVGIPLPKATHDFHFIVGPNEAGKSTVRGAIADLLFGFPARYASMAFVHPQSDLRLAATVSEGEDLLCFVRTKGNKNTLRTPTDGPLPDDALIPFIGQAERGFFESMFGLSHAQLVAGGEQILDASKDVNQVLFQSAAGIASLGKVKESLLAEADRLWGPRHSSSRAYSVASTEYEQAGKDLKAATVRTKSWGDARTALDGVEERMAAATERKAQLQVKRQKLERVRRLAPKVAELNQKLAALAALGEVLDLPAGSAETHRAGAHELSIAETTLRQCEIAVEQLMRQRDEVVIDAAILGAKEDIRALVASGERVRSHYTGLVTSQAEVDRFVLLAQAAAAELGWPPSDDVDALRARLPGPLTIRELKRLAHEHGALHQTQASAAANLEDKQAELAEAEEELKRLVVAEVSAALRSAIAQAQAHRNSAAAQAKLDVAVKAAGRTLKAAQDGLGQWGRSVEALRQMAVPSNERLAGLVTRRQRLESDLDVATDRVEEAERDLAAAKLAVKQFVEARQIVTNADVQEARDKRDTEWASIKARTIPLESGAAGLDAAIDLADQLADTLLGATTDATKLQSLRQDVERADAGLSAAMQGKDRRAEELAAFDAEWAATTAALALPGLALADAQGWMAKRELVLSAAITLDEKKDALDQEVQSVQAAIGELMAQLAETGLSLPADGSLSSILAVAEKLVSDSDGASARRSLLTRQRESGESAVSRLQAAAEAAGSAYADWESKWAAAVVATGLAEYVKTVDDAEQALAELDAVKQNLEKAATTKRDRIDAMNRDIDEFRRSAAQVVEALQIEALREADPRDVVRDLSPKLKEAEAGETRHAAAQEALTEAIRQRDAAKNQVEKVNATLAPLLSAAGVSNLADASPLVAQSEEKRKLLGEIEAARIAIIQGSDGLSLDAVIEEVAEFDVAQVAIELTSTNDTLEQVQAEQTRLAAEHTQAKLTVEGFGGGSDAAIAEARRQEALAAMADASERYVRVTAAAKLLGWAIERYREQNQGPLLTRAAAIFQTLTLGRFTRLLVDFETAAPRLTALRKDGQTVEVPGLSEGTRDQLYLALRLAALELHLGKAKALPFLADDLFINFDDERSSAGLEALRELSTKTQVLFLSHHDHLLPRVQQVFGPSVNVVHLQR